MHYICNMKTEGKKFNLEERFSQYKKDSAQLLYDLASDLLSQVSDDDVLQLYKDNKVFMKISTMSNEDLLNNVDILKESINILINYLETRPLTKEEFEEMTIDEIFQYISDLIEDKELTLFDIIKYLE